MQARHYKKTKTVHRSSLELAWIHSSTPHEDSEQLNEEVPIYCVQTSLHLWSVRLHTDLTVPQVNSTMSQQCLQHSKIKTVVYGYTVTLVSWSGRRTCDCEKSGSTSSSSMHARPAKPFISTVSINWCLPWLGEERYGPRKHVLC
jgi:hypothetical protein